MQWFSLFLRLFLARKAFQETQSLQETALLMAEKGKRYILAALFFAFSGLFVFSALMLAVINLGLQLERDGGLSFSGLMISSTILLGFGLCLALLGLFLWQRKKMPPPEEKGSQGETKVKELLEEFLVGFLSQLSGSTKTSPKPPSETTEVR